VSSVPEWYEGTLTRQLQMNPATWEALQKHGVTEESQLRLDFFFNAPSKPKAEQLAAFLRTEIDYDVVIGQHKKKGLLAKPGWTVEGKTQPTSASLEILNDWVTWMVGAGAEHGACQFDGWGTQPPPA
jgi:hypothetical protein